MSVEEGDKVIEGRDGFLFLVNDTNEMLEQHAGRRPFSHDRLEQWRKLLERRIELVAAAGGKYVFAVAPDNPSVYPEKLPEGFVPAARRPVHQLIEHLEACESRARVLYPLDELVAHKDRQLVCERVGTHWTDFGAFIAYRAILEALGDGVAARVLTERDVYYMDGASGLDLGGKLDPPRTEAVRTARVVHNAGHPVYDNCVFSTGSLIVTTCGVAPPTKCVVFGDSYMYALLKFIPDTFRRTVFVHRPTIPVDVLEQERPDLVISMMAERFLIAVPDDGAGRAQGELEAQQRTAARLRGPFAPHGTRPNLASLAHVEAVRSQMLAAGRRLDATVVSLMAYAGLSPRDVMDLRWDHVGDGCLELPSRRAEDAGRRVPLWPVVARDLGHWRSARTWDGSQNVFRDPSGAWGIADWGAWRASAYAPVVKAVGLGRLAPWALHNTYVHLRLVEGAAPAEVAAETGTPTRDYAIARARADAAAYAAPPSADELIEAARASVKPFGEPPAVS